MFSDGGLQVRYYELHVFRTINISCRTGKYVGEKFPGANLAVMMIEGIIPEWLKNWFGVAKKAIIDRTDDCDQEFLCSFDDQD